MPYSSGTFTLVAGNPVVTGTTISSTWANNTLNDIATALSTAMLKDGTQTCTASIPFAAGMTTTTLGVSGIATLTGVTKSGAEYFATTGAGSLNQNATFDVTLSANSPSGLIFLREQSGGTWALFGFSTDGPAATAVIAQSGTTYSNAQGTGTKINVYINAGKVRIENTNATSRAVNFNLFTVSS